MATTEVLLLKPVFGLGAEGDQVKVKSGYARNYLLPRKIALPITQANRKHIESLHRARAEREAKELDAAKEIAKKLEGINLVFAVKTGEGGKLFGSVTTADVFAKLQEQGVAFDKRALHMHSVKELGKHQARIKLHADVVVELAFEVVSENPIVAEEAPAEAAPEKEKARPRRGKKAAEKSAEAPAAE